MVLKMNCNEHMFKAPCIFCLLVLNHIVRGELQELGPSEIPWALREVHSHQTRGRILREKEQTLCVKHFSNRKQVHRLYSLGHSFIDYYDETGGVPSTLESVLTSYEREPHLQKIKTIFRTWAKREVWGGKNFFLEDECITTLLKESPHLLWNCLTNVERDYVILEWRGLKELANRSSPDSALMQSFSVEAARV